MASAAILCTQCGAVSATALAQCAKCSGKNARVCAGCGFQNSLAKNYCDKCGNSISEIGSAVAPPPPTAVPGEPQSGIPATAAVHIAKNSSGETSASAQAFSLPNAKQKAAEPGASYGSPLPPAGRQAAESFAMPGVSSDPWSTATPPRTAKASSTPWFDALRRSISTLALAVVIASMTGVWYWNERGKPENASHRAAVRYLESLRRQDYDAAYSQFSDAAKEHCSLAEFIASRDVKNWTWSKLSLEHAEPGAILFSYDLKIEGAAPRTDRVLFIEENKRWVRPYTWALMRKVEESFDRSNPDAGLVLAQTAAAVDPRDPMARAYICEAAYYRRTPVDTERQCLAALELSRVYPSNLSLKSLYHLHAILADTYKNSLRKPDLALDQFTQMLAFPRISPSDQCEILLARSEAYIALDRPGEALSDVNQASRLCTRRRDFADIDLLRRKLNAPNQ